MTSRPIVVVLRDPDASNEFRVFGGGAAIHDIDFGYADLSDRDEFADWSESHLLAADAFEAEGDVAAVEAAAFLREVVREARERYNHEEDE